MQLERSSLQRSGWAWLTAAMALLGAGRAAAQTCGSEVQCAPGYVCATSPGLQCTGCTPTWPEPGVYDAGAVPTPGTGADAGVVAAEGGAEDVDAGWCEPTCVPYDYHYCEPAPCSADADCPGSMICHAETYYECSGGWCEAGLSCEDDGGYKCTEHTRSTCAERYNVPCRADDDCGPGFDCNRDPYTSCSGGGGVEPAPDGGWIFIDAGYECTSVTPDTGWCLLQELPCESDSECPTSMSCQAQYQWPPCGPVWDGAVPWADAGNGTPGDASRTPVTDSGVTFPAEPNGDAGPWFPWECTPPLVKQVCRPESWGGGGSTGGFPDGGVVGGGGFAGGAGGGYPDDAGVWFDAGAPTSGGGTQAGGGTPGGGAVGAGSADAGAGQGPGGEDGNHGHHGGGVLHKLLHLLLGGSGGCSVAGESTHGNLAWLCALSFALVARVRRRRG